jgi:DNA polymerase I
MKLISIDFEFRGASEPQLDLVAACLYIDAEDSPTLYWLHDRQESKIRLADRLRQYEGSTILSYYSPAEARGLQSLGLNPLKYQWFDLWVAYRYWMNAPHISRGNTGLVQCCNDLGVSYSHAEQKNEIRDIILTNKNFSKDERDRILYYCMDDTRVLHPLFSRIVPRLCKTYGKNTEYIIKTIRYLSYYSTCLGTCETTGTPIDYERLNNLSYNYKLCKTWLVEQIPYPFFQWNPRKEEYTFKYAIFDDFLRSNNLDSDWPTTPTGRFSTERKTLDELGHLHPTLKIFSEYNKILNSIKYFNPNSFVFSETIGHDYHSRSSLGPYGTMSGRNAPKASRYLPAMSSVFRVLIRPEPGWAVTGIDWSAQEFALGALLSNDKVMWEAYLSGDPYMYFAKAAGAVPPDGTKKEYKAERNLFKATVLGLQYSMGVKKLRLKLCHDTGKDISIYEAQRLVNLHKSTFEVYWSWVKSCDMHTKKMKPFFSLDGWACQSDPDSLTSMRNFPVQSAGAALMRYAIIKGCQKGLKILFPLHDALYLYHKESDDKSPRLLEQCMDEAVTHFFPGAYIRHETESHTYNDLWIESRCKDIYDKLNLFFSEKDPNVEVSKQFSPELESFNLFD